MLSKAPVQLSLFAVISTLFFLTFSWMLTANVSIWSLVFLLSFILIYFTWRISTKRIIWSIARIITATGLILLSLANFAHFKIFGSFITGNSGFGRIPNLSEASLLAGYWNTVPIFLYATALILIAFIIFLEFFWKNSAPLIGSKYLNYLQSAVIVFIFILYTLPLFFVSPSWYSSKNYFSDIGPIGYFGVDIERNIFEKIGINRIITPKDTLAALNDTSSLKPSEKIQQLMTQLTVPSHIEQISLPDFKTAPNILVYQLESVPQWAIDIEDTPMPYLKQLMQDNITVDHFYGNDCHTIGAEFTGACSILTSGNEVVGNRLEPIKFSCLPKKLSTIFDYDTSIYHANFSNFWNREKILPQLGYDNLYFSPFLPPRMYDGLVAEKLVEKINKLNKPSWSYLVGYTSHGPHTSHYIERNLKESGITITPYSGELPAVTDDLQLSKDELRNYFGFLTSVDQAIKGLFDQLKVTGELDNTIVVIYGDHRYYGFDSDSPKSVQLHNELPFMIYVPGMSPQKLPITASHIDIAPTISQLLDIDPQQTKDFMGRSIFSAHPYNFALGKCGDESYLFSGDKVIYGNRKVGLYSELNFSTNEVRQADAKQLQIIKKISAVNDQLWSYDKNLILPNKTLIQGDSADVFIIVDEMKRKIANENIFVELGYTPLDIHKISDAMLEKYPSGEPITKVVDELKKDALSINTTKSILRPDSTLSTKRYVAHALGSAGGITGSNSKEAFEESYSKGFRIFETDFSLTSDGQVVLFHEGNEFNLNSSKLITELTKDEFLKLKFQEKLTLLSLDGLFALMKQYPDAYIILDSKENFETILNNIVAQAKKTDPQLLSRIIPQIYETGQLKLTLSMYNFNDIIYTLYLTEPSDQSVLSFVKNNPQITAITQRDRRYNTQFKNELLDSNVSLYVHTINDKEQIQQFIDQNVGVYTDY